MSTTSTSVTRTQSYVSVPGGRCLVVVDVPNNHAPKLAVVIAHGLTGDRSGPADLLSELSAQVCERSAVTVVRFDFRGSGDSDGHFEATTFAGMASDFTAVTFAATTELPLICAGISIGGVPAVMAAHELVATDARAVTGVVLMSSDLVQDVRFGVDVVTPIRGGEFHLPGSFFQEREQIRPRALLREIGSPFLLVHGHRDDKLVAAAPWFTESGGEVVVTNSDHLFEDRTARQALLDAWVTFLARVDPTDRAQ